MNKVLVGVISSLATLGIVGGAGAIALSSPDVKENLSVSFGQSDLLGNNVSNNNNKINELTGQLSETKILLQVEQNKVLDLTNQVDELKEDKTQYKVQIANLKGDNANLTSEVATLNNKVTIANNKITTLENRVSSYQTQVTNLRNTNSQLNTNLNNLRSENMQLESDLSIATSELEIMNSELEILKQDNNNNIQQIQDLETRISDKESEINELNSQIMSKQMTIYDLEAEVESFNTRISELNAEIDTMTLEIMDLSAERDLLHTQIADLDNTISTNNATISELNSTISTKDEEIMSLQSEIDLSNNTINTLNEEISNLQSNIDELTNYYETALGSNYIIVNYIVDGVDNPKVQKKWSMSEYTAPTKSGYDFMGWSYTENGETLISGQSFAQSVDLYAVYKRKPTIDDFDNYIDINEYTGYCWNSSNGGDYEGIYRYNKQGPSCYRVYSKYYDWKLLLNASNKVLIFCHEEQNKTVELVLNSAIGCVEIASQYFEKYHILSDGSVYMYNDNYHLLYNVETTNTDVRGETNGNVYNTIKQLESGNYIFGSSLETTTNLCHFNMETREFTTIYESGSAWGDIYEFKDNAPLIFSRNGENSNGFIKFDESTMTSDFYEVENCGRIECIWQLDYTLENFLMRFNNCMIVFDGENKEIRNVEYDNSLVAYNQFSLNNWDYIFCTNNGIYLFSKADETVSKIGDIGKVVEHSEYDVTGNCLLITETSEKYVYIANTKTIEEFDENKDYTSYIGENNE